MRISHLPWLKFLLLLSMGLFFILGGHGLAQDAESGAQVAILTPPNGLITLNPLVEVKGTASTEDPEIRIDVVVVSVNGIAQKAQLMGDGTFQASVELAYGENIISAVALASNNEIGSDKVSIILQREVLFFDDFEGERAHSEWAMVTGNWTVEEQDLGIENQVFTIQQEDYGHRWGKGLVTTSWAFVNEGFAWHDYAVEVDVLNNAGWLYYPSGYAGRKTQGLYVAVRARDAQNLVAFEVRSDALGEGRGDPDEGWMCWRVMLESNWSDCFNIVKPSPPPNFRLRMEVNDNLFTAYINGAPVSSWRDRDRAFPQGTAGLGIWHKFKGAKGAFDNFKVVSLEERGAAPAYTGEQPEAPSEVAVSEWQRTVNQINQEIKPVVVTLQNSVGGHEVKIQELKGRVNSLEGVLGERLEPLKLTVEKLASRYNAIENKLEGFSKLIARIPLDIDVTLSSLQEKTDVHGGEIQALKEDLKRVESAAWLGLIAGATGLALTGLVALGVIG